MDPAFFFTFVPVFVIGLAILLGIRMGRQRTNLTIMYRASLEELRLDPTNALLREKTLGLGRAYCNNLRNNQGVMMVDEEMIKNDIEAATAGAVRQVNVDPKAAESPTARLHRLEEVKTQGLISDNEYQIQRERILAEI